MGLVSANGYTVDGYVGSLISHLGLLYTLITDDGGVTARVGVRVREFDETKVASDVKGGYVEFSTERIKSPEDRMRAVVGELFRNGVDLKAVKPYSVTVTKWAEPPSSESAMESQINAMLADVTKSNNKWLEYEKTERSRFKEKTVSEWIGAAYP